MVVLVVIEKDYFRKNKDKQVNKVELCVSIYLCVSTIDKLNHSGHVQFVHATFSRLGYEEKSKMKMDVK